MLEVNENAPFLEMKNGIEKEIKYDQKFVRAALPKSYPTNESAKNVDHSKVMTQVLTGK